MQLRILKRNSMKIKMNMKKLILSGLITMMLFPVKAQENYSFDFGRVTGYEMDMKTYPSDENAEAVVIYEKGTNYFSSNDAIGGFLLIMQKSVKIKILKQSGVKYGNIEIPYYNSDKPEMVYDLEGITYNYDGKELTKSSLDPKNVYVEKINENWQCKKFAMPDVREGSVIELKYTIATSYFFNMREWMFQKKIPVVNSQFSLRVIPYYEYTYIVKGAAKFDEQSSVVLSDILNFGNLKYQEVQYKFGMKNIPAFRDEEFITSSKDYMVSMNFQLSKIHYPQGGSRTIMSTWPEICDEFLKDDDFGKFIKNAEKESKKILPELNLAGKSPKEQLKIITEYVKNNYNWNGRERKYTEVKFADFMKQKTGSSAEINLFLIGLLKAAQIGAVPLLLSTRSNGVINVKYPFSSFFNYVIAGVEMEGETVFIDATESMLLYNELPERCVNVQALVVKPKSDKWIDIVQNDVAFTDYALDIRLNDSSDSLLVDVISSFSAYDGYNLRKIYYGKQDNLIKYLESEQIEPVDLQVTNYGELEDPFILSYRMDKESEKNGDKLFIAPFQKLSPAENIFKQTSRTLPVDLIYLHGASFKSTIHIPKGYKIEHLPGAYQNDGPYMKLDYAVNASDDKIEISAAYRFKSNTYEAKRYTALKATFEKIVSLFNEMIVIVKE